MNKPIPHFTFIYDWGKSIILMDKEDYQWECTNVGGFERALLDNHDWMPEAKKYLNSNNFEDYRKDFDLLHDVNRYIQDKNNEGKFEEYFKCINE